MDKQANSVEELNRIIKEKQQKIQPSIWSYLIVSVLFPPLGLILSLILAWKRELLDLVLPAVTILVSILSAISIFLIYSALNPILALIQILHEKTPTPLSGQIRLLITLTLTFSAVGVIFGFYFRSKGKRGLKLSQYAITLLIVLLLTQFLLSLLNIYSVNSFIYRRVSDFTLP